MNEALCDTEALIRRDGWGQRAPLRQGRSLGWRRRSWGPPGLGWAASGPGGGPAARTASPRLRGSPWVGVKGQERSRGSAPVKVEDTGVRGLRENHSVSGPPSLLWSPWSKSPVQGLQPGGAVLGEKFLAGLRGVGLGEVALATSLSGAGRRGSH